jgi:class 3 adenylate cyclase/CHASE2 domain-containing sensor protein
MDDATPISNAAARAAAVRRRQWLLGIGATLIVLALQATGWLNQSRTELASLDTRATLFGRGSPPPSDEIAIVAIDDQAIDAVGRWPWHRERLAQALEELRLAGASVIALDLLLSEPQDERIRPGPEGGGFTAVHDDDLLAAAMSGHGRVVLATNFSLGVPREGADGAISALAVDAALREHPHLRALPAAEAVDALEQILTPDAPVVGRAQRRAALLAALRAAQAFALHEAGSSAPAPPDLFLWPRSTAPEPPVPLFAEAAARLANVTLDSLDGDGRLRRVPLVVEARGRLWPVLGVAAVALHRGVGAGELVIGPRDAVMRFPGGEILATLRRDRAGGRHVDGVMYLAWPRGETGWLRQFPPAPADAIVDESGRRASTVSILAVLNPVLIGERLARNVGQLDEAVRRAAAAGLIMPPEGYDAVAAAVRAIPAWDPQWPERFAAAEPAWRSIAEEAAGLLAMVEEAEPATDEERAVVDTLREIATKFPLVLGEIRDGVEQIRERRARAAALLGGRICFVGFTYTAALADVVSTSIDPRTPGVCVHAAIANSLLTGLQRTSVPPWVDLAAVAALGLLGTFVGVRGTVITGPLFVVLLVVLWFLVAGVVFWDGLRLIVAFTGPSLAAGGGWLAVMLHRLLVEQRARRRTEERFRSYVSPAVVDILVSNPSLDSMVPQKRELTVLFTDLAGFTTIAERLGSIRTAEVLATYLGAMTDILQSSGATLDKYLGDGIMAFWGAPIADPRHASAACEAVLRMVRTLDEMNDLGAFGDAGRLEMRAGLASGDLMVGDFGNPPRNSSYTVIGDAANLAARLESANRYLGTRILISQRLRDLAGPSLLVRPIGRIAVKGKHAAEMIYELVGDLEPHGPRTAEWVDLTRRAVEAYQRADFREAEAAFDRLEREFGDVGLAGLYRQAMQEWRRRAKEGGADGGVGGAPAGFDGTISLSEK